MTAKVIDLAEVRRERIIDQATQWWCQPYSNDQAVQAIAAWPDLDPVERQFIEAVVARRELSQYERQELGRICYRIMDDVAAARQRVAARRQGRQLW